GAHILDVYDVTHRVALALKGRLEANPRGAAFLAQVGQSRNAAKQTEWAFLLPPALRTKSRYLNLGELIRWAARTGWLVEHRRGALLEHGDPQRLQEKFGWLSGFADELGVWRAWYRVAARAVGAVRQAGLHANAAADLRRERAAVTAGA